MKRLLLMLVLFLCWSTDSSAQIQKNIVKSYPMHGAQLIQLAADGMVEVEEWDEKIVRLVTTVDAVNFNAATLKALAEAGRYTCTAKEHDGALILTMLKAQKELTIRGTTIEEKYQFKIFIPRGTTIEQVAHEEVAALF